MPPLLEKYDEEVKQYGSLSAIKDDAVGCYKGGQKNLAICLPNNVYLGYALNPFLRCSLHFSII